MRSATTIPLAEPREPVSEALIRTLVETFYARIRRDPELGPIFEKTLEGRWDAHLANMVDFWSSVILKTGTYGGKPHVAHAPLGLGEEHFASWLGLFEATVREVCPPATAALFIDRAHRIAESLQIGLGIGPKALRLPSGPRLQPEAGPTKMPAPEGRHRCNG